MNHNNNQSPPYHRLRRATGQARNKIQTIRKIRNPKPEVRINVSISQRLNLIPKRNQRFLTGQAFEICSLFLPRSEAIRGVIRVSSFCLVIVSWLLYLIFSVSPVYAEEKQPLDITSDEVEYAKVKGKEVVIFTGHVVATQKTTTLKSDQLKLFPDENKAVATGHAWMRDEKEKMILTGERIEYYHDKRYGMATGKPRLVSEKEDFTLTSKKMEIFLPEDRLRATGKVKLVRDDMVATCKILDYFDKEKKAILTGNPQIKEKENLVTGDKITLYVDEYRVIVEDKARIKFKASEFE